jgi:hypothetical protein
MKTWGSGGIASPFLTSALVGSECSASRPGLFAPGTYWIGGWVGPRAGVYTAVKWRILLPAGIRTLAIHTELLYVLIWKQGEVKKRIVASHGEKVVRATALEMLPVHHRRACDGAVPSVAMARSGCSQCKAVPVLRNGGKQQNKACWKVRGMEMVLFLLNATCN